MKTTQEYEKELHRLQRLVFEQQEEIKTLRSEKLVGEVDELLKKETLIEEALTEEVVAEFLKERFGNTVSPEGGNLRAKTLMSVDWNAWWLTLAAELIKFIVEKFLEKKKEKEQG